MLDVDALAVFIAVAEARSFTRAADRLGIVQSVVSKRLRRLEDQLGMILVDRRLRTDIRLTRSGRLFLPEARQALASLQRVERVGRNLGRGSSGPLRMGFVFSAAMTGLLSAAVAELRAKLPDLRVEPRLLETPEQLKALEEGSIDIGLLRPRPAYPDGCHSRTIQSEGLVVGLASNHPLCAEALISPRQLADEVFIVPQFHEEVGLIDSIRQLSIAGRFEIRDLVRTGDFVTAACLAAAGAGVVLAPASLARLHLDNICYRRLAGYEGSISIALVWRDDAPESAVSALAAMRR